MLFDVLLASEVLAADLTCESLDRQMRHVNVSAQIEPRSEGLAALFVVALIGWNLIRDHL